MNKAFAAIMNKKASLFAGEGWLSCSLRGEFIRIIR